MSQFIDGKRCEALSGQTDVVRDPSTGEIVEEITLAGPEDVDRAVQAARAAFPAWSTATPVDRSTALTNFARLLGERAEEIASLESRIAGKPIRLAREFDVPGTIDNVAFFAGAARNLEGKATAEYSGDHTSSIRREPVGVVGSISPWNYPLQMAAWKILPAIAAGNTIVLKPSELTPLSSLLFAEIATEAGIPPGVVNVLTGTGADCGSVLLRHREVDMVSFTGSTRVGRTVLEAAATTAKRVHLELGGKAPFVVFDDADLEAAIHGAVAGEPDQRRSGLHRRHPGDRAPLPLRRIRRRGRRPDGLGAARTDRRSGHRPGSADLDGPPGQGGRHGRPRPRRTRGSSPAARSPAVTWPRGSYYHPTLIADAGKTSEVIRDEVFGPVLVRDAVRLRRRGDHAGQRHPVRAGRLGLDPRRLPRAAGDPGDPRRAASGSTTTSRSSARCRTAG